VARAKPAVLAEHLAGRLLVLVVAGEDRLTADQQLAVLLHAHLEAGQGGPDGAEAKATGPVDRGGGGALGQAPPFDDQDVDRVEECGDLLRERRPAGDAEPQPAAEPVLDLRIDQPVGYTVPERQSTRNRFAALAQLADLPSDSERPVQQPPPWSVHLLELRQHRRVHLLVEPRHARQQRRAYC